MHLSPVLLTIFAVISLARCQFVYNYEEADTDGSSDNTDGTLYQFNSPSATNEQFQSRRVQNTANQDEVQKPRRNTVRATTSAPQVTTAAPTEFIEESETPRNSEGPRKRKYRRILREGTYEAPPATPRVYSPSIFENIELGQAPSGVYVPQDSFLNVLRNPSYRQSSPSQYVPQSAPTYYQPPIAPAMYFVNPPSNNEARAQFVEPKVQYVDSSSSVSTEDTNAATERPNRRRSQTPRQGRQRQQNRPVEPMVDIDVLRTRTDTFPDTTSYVPQARQVSQPTVTVNRQRPTTALQSFQTPRTYSPSVFQNIGLGEAPNGVHIPPDSLLNVLRSSPSRSSPRNDYDNSQYSNNVNAEEPNNFQPETSVQPTSPPADSRRRSRQRTRITNTSNRDTRRRTQYQPEDEQPTRRRTQYQPEDEEPQRITEAPVSTRQQRRQQGQRRNSESNRRNEYSVVEERRQNSPKQEVREASRQSQSSSSNRQTNYKPAKLAIAALPEDTDDDGIPGEAGVNYPTLHTIPRTSFSCSEQQHNGYYADLETSCQVVHLCQARGVKNSFLCPNGTIFSQEKFSCQWWYKVNCEESPQFYSINDSLYKTPEKKKTSRD